MRAFFQWIRRLRYWIAEPRQFWLFLAVAALSVLLSLTIPRPLDDDIRYAGLALQLLGVSTVIRGLRDRGKLFGKPTLAAATAAWFARFPSYKPGTVTLQASGIASASAVASVSAYVWRGYRKEDPVDARLAALAENLETLRTQQERATSSFAGQVAKVQELVQQEQTARSTDIRQVQQKLAELGAGGLHIEIVGVAWLVAGIVLATVPSELAAIFAPRH